MLLDKILEIDTRSCYTAIKGDSELASLDVELYNIMDKLLKADGFKLESIFSQYMARVTRIAYLQGMKDFMNLCVTLKDDAAEIVEECVKLK